MHQARKTSTALCVFKQKFHDKHWIDWANLFGKVRMHHNLSQAVFLQQAKQRLKQAKRTLNKKHCNNSTFHTYRASARSSANSRSFSTAATNTLSPYVATNNRIVTMINKRRNLTKTELRVAMTTMTRTASSQKWTQMSRTMRKLFLS